MYFDSLAKTQRKLKIPLVLCALASCRENL
jgi:hypothetical protein